MSDICPMDQSDVSSSNLAFRAHTLSTTTAATLLAHVDEDKRIHESLIRSAEAMTAEIKSINKWIWIVTGSGIALSKTLDLVLKHLGN